MCPDQGPGCGDPDKGNQEDRSVCTGLYVQVKWRVIMNDMNDRQKLHRKVDRYLKGELTTAEADRLWADVLRHPELLDEMEAEAAARLLIRSSREGRTDPKQGAVAGAGSAGKSNLLTRIPPLRWMAGMAVVVVLAVGLALWSSDYEHTVPDRIELTEMIAPDIYRDSKRGYDEKDVLINEGLALALRERPDEAVRTYRELLDRELTGTQEDAVRINLAILFYNSGAFEKTQSELNRLLEHSRADRPERLTGKSWWMLGMSQVKLDKPADAILSFEEALRYDQIHEERIREWIQTFR